MNARNLNRSQYPTTLDSSAVKAMHSTSSRFNSNKLKGDLSGINNMNRGRSGDPSSSFASGAPFMQKRQENSKRGAAMITGNISALSKDSGSPQGSETNLMTDPPVNIIDIEANDITFSQAR